MKDQKSILQDGIKKIRIKEKEKQREKNDEKKKMKEREEESGAACINKWAEYTNGPQIATNVLKQVMLRITHVAYSRLLPFSRVIRL